jgi:hypothetical protein
MNGKQSVLRDIVEQFRDGSNAIIEAIMTHLRADNATRLLGPSLSPLMDRGSLRGLVALAVYADVLRVIRDVTIIDGHINDAEIQESLGMLSVIAAAFAKARRNDYAAYSALTTSTAKDFLLQYSNDAGPFGYRNDATRWASRNICRSIDNTYSDTKPLSLLGATLFNWAQAIATTDESSPSEQQLLISLANILNVSPADHTPAVSPLVDREPSTAVGLPATENEKAAGSQGKPQKDCPYCGETILVVAVKCKHCGEMLGESLVAESTPGSRTEPSAALAGRVSSVSALLSDTGREDREVLATNGEAAIAEITRTCNKCGKVWFSDLREEEDLESSSDLDNGASLMLLFGGAVSGFGRAGSITSADSMDRFSSRRDSSEQQLTSLRRCPQCNSKSYTEVRPKNAGDGDKKPPSFTIMTIGLIGFVAFLAILKEILNASR